MATKWAFRVSLEISYDKVTQKVAKMMQNGGPGVPLGARRGSQNGTKTHKSKYFVYVFHVAILEGLPGRIFDEIGSK